MNILKKEVEENKITEKLSIEFEQKLSIMDSRISEIQQNAEKELNLKDFIF